MDSGSLVDSMDLVVVGGDWGKGKRAGVFGSFLLACYDPSTGKYQTITKVATGLSDENLQIMHDQFIPLVIPEPHEDLIHREKTVDVWFEPKFVWEVRCADITLSPKYCASINLLSDDKGLALRFPRFFRSRDDKKAKEATTSE